MICKVSKWKTAAQKLQDKSSLERIEDAEDDLKSLMAGLGAKVKGEIKNAGTSLSILGLRFTKLLLALKKLTEKMRASLASEEDVAEVITLYQDLFRNEEPVDYDNLNHQLGLDVDFTGNEVDPGITVERNMSAEQLAADLGFVSGRPILFNAYRHCSGSLNAWQPTDTNTPERYNKEDNNDTEMVPLNLHWHQLCGIHAIVRQTFSENPTKGFIGTGNFDQVGIGKSYQALGYCGFLMDNVQRQNEEVELAPILRAYFFLCCLEDVNPLTGRRPYLGDSKEIPDLPTLIAAPGTLIAQWTNEAQVVFRFKSVDILVYPPSRKEQLAFWEPDGPYHSSKHSPSRRIIITSHNVSHGFCTMYRLLEQIF